jgi:glycosyltransferase involved in cell wall biosynthesis
MKVLFDHQIFSMQKYGGISRYFAGLHQGVNALPGNQSRISVLYSENEYIKNEAIPFNNNLGAKLFSTHYNRKYRWNRRYSAYYLRRNNFDVFHPTFYDDYFLPYLKKPLVLTVHDMIHELHTELFDNTAHEIIRQKKALIDKADAIISISAHTKSDIVKLYPHVAAKISVVHHGFVLNNSTHNPIPDLPHDYILFVGDRWHYKNFSLFVTAISGLLRSNKSLKLICTGGGAFTPAENELLASLHIQDQCMQMGVTDAGLAQLYRQAKVFVFPSLQEGFGLPLLEAFANHCPVVCSNITSLPEVAGDAAIYFNPTEPDSIVQAVTQVLHGPALQQELKNKGQQRLALFSFDACVKNTLNVYQSVL